MYSSPSTYRRVRKNRATSQLSGGSGSDVIYAGSGGLAGAATQVVAGSGNATIYGGNGVDHLEGGDGTDVIYAGDGGGDGAPTSVIAGSGVASLYGGAGTSFLDDSLGGHDLLQAGSGETTLTGIGDDTLVAGSGDDYLAGGASGTYLFGSNVGVTEVVGGGDEALEFTSSVDSSDLSLAAAIDGSGAGSLAIDEGDGSITVDGGLSGASVASVDFEGSQFMSLSQLIEQEAGLGNAGPQTVSGTLGNLLFDPSSSDSIAAGSGQDTISAWGNEDTLTAGSGNTSVFAEGANDSVVGSSGNDTLDAAAGGTTLIGGTGNEVFRVSDTTDVVQGLASAASNKLYSSVSYTLPTNVDALTLTGSGDLSATGNDDAQNIITANAGNDTLTAGSGDDTLVAGAGADVLEGRGGSTTYAFDSGFGQAEVEPGGGSSTMEFGSGIAPADLKVGLIAGSSGSPALLIEDGTSRITIDGGLGGSINSFEFSDGSQLGLAALLRAASPIAGSIVGSAGDGVLNTSAAASLAGTGNDTILGTGASDTLVAGIGNEYLLAAGDHASMSGGAGDDTLVGGGSDSTVVAGSGNQLLYGLGAGDVLTGGIGDDTLFGGTGPEELAPLLETAG